MTHASDVKTDFRSPKAAKKLPRAVADGAAGLIIAVADVAGTPQRVYQALTTTEIEKWWKWPGLYHQKDFKADLRVQGPWSVAVELDAGGQVRAHGEFCELVESKKIVMTRVFEGHPLLGSRETTITYLLEPSPHGTLVTVRDEGFVGRSEAAYGNAEIWERVLGWLDTYLEDKPGH